MERTEDHLLALLSVKADLGLALLESARIRTARSPQGARLTLNHIARSANTMRRLSIRLQYPGDRERVEVRVSKMLYLLAAYSRALI